MKDRLKKLTENMWNLPNALTMFRIVLIPVFAVLYLKGLTMWALGAFLLASITDMFDGKLARKLNLVTAFGKLMDPLADKLMVCTILICMTVKGVIPAAAPAIVIAKELLMVIGGVYLLKRGIVTQAIMIGKVATCVFIAAIVSAFFHDWFRTALQFPLDTVLLWVAVGLTLIALVIYAGRAFAQLKEAGKQGGDSE